MTQPLPPHTTEVCQPPGCWPLLGGPRHGFLGQKIGEASGSEGGCSNPNPHTTLLLQSMTANYFSKKEHFSVHSYEKGAKWQVHSGTVKNREALKIFSHLWMVLPHLVHNSEDMELPFVTLCQRFEDFTKPFWNRKKRKMQTPLVVFQSKV